MTSIYLARHGQNEFVEKGKLAGWLPGIHLNEDGEAQAAQVADHLRSVKLQAVYSSPLERAAETAGRIASAQGLRVRVREELGELRIGRWQGLSLKAVRRRKLWHMVQSAPSLARFPGGESFAEAQSRIVGELERLRSSHAGRRTAIACVSHADPIKLAIAYYLGLPLDLFQRLVIDTASVSLLNLNDQTAQLTLLNHNSGPLRAR